VDAVVAVAVDAAAVVVSADAKLEHRSALALT